MKKTTISGFISLALSCNAFADAAAIKADEVVVTASRLSQPKVDVIGDITVINQEQIERAGATSISDLLRLQPGVQISTNGGAGKESNIYLRGTNADHIVVLVDGIRLNSATSGKTAFENIPLAQIERIEILRGPASSLYGADAIGGVIQIFTKKGTAGSPILHAAAGLGSYNTKTAEAGLSGSVGDTRYGINLSRFDTDGFSSRRIRAKNLPIDKDDDGYRNLSVNGFLEHTLAEGHSLGIQFFQSQGHNKYDGGNNFDNYGEQTLQSYALTSKNRLASFWNSTLKVGRGLDDADDYAKPTGTNPTGIGHFRSEQEQLTWQNDFKLPLGTLTLAYDHLGQEVKSVSSPISKFSQDRSNDGFLASYLLNHDAHSLQLSLREDHNTQYGANTTGGVGYGYRIAPEWRVNASYGKAFKAPTFNQLYFFNSGNPNIKPEESENVEASLRHDSSRIHAGLTVFENKIKNLIEFSGPPNGFTAINVAKADIYGATFDASWNVNESWLISGNFTAQSPRNEETDELLARRGNRYGNVALLHTWGGFQWGAEITGASPRYNTSTNTRKMDGYMLVNLTANYRISPEWKLEGRANNILDKEYILAYTNNTTGVAYNTPGSNVFVGLRYQMKP